MLQCVCTMPTHWSGYDNDGNRSNQPHGHLSRDKMQENLGARWGRGAAN